MGDNLKYGKTYWEGILPATKLLSSERDKLHLVFSLIIYLGISFSKIFTFAFTSDDPRIRQRAGTFLAVPHAGIGRQQRYAPAELHKRWHSWSPAVRHKLHSRFVKLCMEEIAVTESNAIIEEKTFKVSLKKLTIADIYALLRPAAIMEKLCLLAPFTDTYLHALPLAPERSVGP